MSATLRKLIAANSAFIGTDGSDFDFDIFLAFARKAELIPALSNPSVDADDLLDFPLGGGNLFDIADRFGVDLVVGGSGADQLSSGGGAIVVAGPGNDGGYIEDGAAFGGPGSDSFDGPASFVHGGPGSDYFRPHNGMIIADFTPADTLNFYGTASFREDLVFEADGKGNTIVRYQDRAEDGHLVTKKMLLLGLDPADIDPASILTASGDDYPADTSTTGFIPLDGTAVTGSIGVGDDVDWFRVELPMGQAYEFDFTEDPIFLSARFYNSAGEPVGYFDDVWWTDELVVQSAQGGTYYLAVSAWEHSSGDYEISAVPTDDTPLSFI